MKVCAFETQVKGTRNGNGLSGEYSVISEPITFLHSVGILVSRGTGEAGEAICLNFLSKCFLKMFFYM